MKVRQRMAFSSFSLPNKRPEHSDWDHRDGDNPRSWADRDKLRQEREIMTLRAEEDGCDLILDPFVTLNEQKSSDTQVRLKHAPDATAPRLRTLIEFLSDMPDDKARVVLQKGKIDGSLIAVGDLFVAEAVVPHYRGGYRQTMFTHHAPTVLSRVRDFDRLFAELLDEQNVEGRSSREVAIDTLRDLLAECEGR